MKELVEQLLFNDDDAVECGIREEVARGASISFLADCLQDDRFLNCCDGDSTPLSRLCDLIVEFRAEDAIKPLCVITNDSRYINDVRKRTAWALGAIGCELPDDFCTRTLASELCPSFINGVAANSQSALAVQLYGRLIEMLRADALPFHAIDVAAGIVLRVNPRQSSVELSPLFNADNTKLAGLIRAFDNNGLCPFQFERLVKLVEELSSRFDEKTKANSCGLLLLYMCHVFGSRAAILVDHAVNSTDVRYRELGNRARRHLRQQERSK